MAPKLVVREFTSVQDSSRKKYLGQIDVEEVAGLDNLLAERVVSRPASGERQVFNITWNPDTEELIIEISETDAV
jgi:hypothetical protein